MIYIVTMLDYGQEIDQEEPEIRLLKEWLPKIGVECRAYIKGASKALLYAQEDPQKMAPEAQKGVLL